MSPFSYGKLTNSRSILVIPSSHSEIITKSSAQSMLPIFVLLEIIAGTFSSLSKILGMSDIKILKSMGLIDTFN